MTISRRAVPAALASGVLGLGVAQLIAAVSEPTTGPLVAVGNAFIDRTPGWLKQLAIGLFGLFDKVALGVGMIAVLAALLAIVGWLAARLGPRIGGFAMLALSLVAATAAWSRPGAGATAVVPSVVGGVLATIVLVSLLGRRETDDARRGFLIGTGAAGVVGLLAAVGSAAVVQRGAAVANRVLPRIPTPRRRALPTPAGVDPVPSITPYQTPNREFYRIDTALLVPDVDPASWRLRVVGLVEKEIELSYTALLDRGLVESWTTLTCVSNEVGGGLAGNALWAGVPIRDVLALARPKPGADMVLSKSVDGWTASTPLDVLTDPSRECLFAVTMNGQPMPREHGYPVRMVVPGLYGYVSATKWVTEIKVTTFAADTAYWTVRGWSPRGPVKLTSRIDVPAAGAQVRAGEVAVAGVAWAQHIGISGVEVSVDGGDFEAARLAPTVGPDTWRQWVFRWNATNGAHRLTVRAIDARGRVQTAKVAEVMPDGATGLHTIDVEVTG